VPPAGAGSASPPATPAAKPPVTPSPAEAGPDGDPGEERIGVPDDSIPDAAVTALPAQGGDQGPTREATVQEEDNVDRGT
jgi:hypothetical protein